MNEIIKSAGFFKSFDGTPIYYESRGEGRPIVLAYGLACTMNHWTHQIRHFSRGYQVVTLDYRGHHRSPAPENRENLTLDAICRDLIELCRFLGIEDASFWGHSYGAQILIRLCDMKPDLVSSLVLINGFASNPIKNMFGLDVIAPAFQIFKESYRTFPETLRSLWKAAVTNPLMIPLSSLSGGFNLALTNLKDVEVYARGVASMDLGIFISLFDQMIKYDGMPALDRIAAPTLIVSGDQDGVTPASYQEKMHEKIKGSQLCRVPYGSHCTQLDLPDYVNLRIEKFLGETGCLPRRRGRAAKARASQKPAAKAERPSGAQPEAEADAGAKAEPRAEPEAWPGREPETGHS